MFQSELSPWQLARELRTEGFDLHYSTVKRIRSLPFYLGLRPNTKGELIKADWPAIIDKKLWDKQQNRPKKASRRSTPGTTYLLSSIVKCANCEGPMVGSSAHTTQSGELLYVYKCLSPYKCPTGGGRVSGWLVDMLVMDALEQYADPEKLKKRYAQALDASQGGLVAERRKQLQTKIQDLEQRQDRLLDAVERGVVTDRAAKKRSRENETALKEAQSKLEVLNASEFIPDLPDLQMILATDISTASLKERHQLLDKLATCVEIDPKERTLLIAWRLGGESRYQIPRFRGGPGRSLERFREIASGRISAYRI